jgi:hypothetical protein
MTLTTAANPFIVRLIRSKLRQLTGRNYQINLEALDHESLRELMRAVSDCEYEQDNMRRKALNPW